MAAASQGTYVSPMAALTQMPHAAAAAAAPLANGLTSPVVPPTSGQYRVETNSRKRVKCAHHRKQLSPLGVCSCDCDELFHTDMQSVADM